MVLNSSISPLVYGRANDLKREMQHAADVVDINPNTAAAVKAYIGAAATEIGASTTLPGTAVVVHDGDVLTEAGGGTIAVAVADGVATYTYTAGA